MNPFVVVEISDGDLVEEVYDEDGEGIGFRVVDHTMWEGGDCPFCQSSNLEVVGTHYHYASRFKEIMNQPDYQYGGYLRCKDCGCDEHTSVSEWIKKGGAE